MSALLVCAGGSRTSPIRFDGKLAANSQLAMPEPGRWGGACARVTQQRAASHRVTYEANHQLIDRISHRTARQHLLSTDDASEFRSFVWERLLAADPLARFGQRCSLSTFLTVVIRNYCRDFRNQRWGKWRPSAAARRLGAVALRLESLIARDGHTFEEAVQIIQTNDRTEIGRPDLEAIHRRLPMRSRLRFVTDELLVDAPVASADADAPLERERQLAMAARLRRALGSALELLDAEDRVIIKLLFEEGLTVAQVAQAMHLPQKPLYRRRDDLLRRLKTHLQESGIAAEYVDAAIGGFDADAEANGSPEPSTASTRAVRSGM